ncbi:MAG: TonB-dependent receptor [Gemmatimonadaceae bacterium]
MLTPAGAQQRDTLRTRADSIRADSIARARARTDSLAKARLDSLAADSLYREDLALLAAQRRRADSIKFPVAAAEVPVLTEHPGVLRWDRAQLHAYGALTLGDFLESVPGLTVFRTGWIGSPEQAAYLGDFSGIRVFYDGVELDALDQRNGGLVDLSFVQIWQLEDIRIERGASELRVHLRSWRVRSVTPVTRVDIGTGDLQTNGYRGFFGRRFSRGEVLQIAGYQYSTRDPRSIGDADQLSLFGRAGWAARGFSLDLSFLRTRRERTEQPRVRSIDRDNLPPIDATFLDAFARLAYTDTLRGWWTQLIASRSSHKQSRILSEDAATGGLPSDTTASDSTAFSTSRRQYVMAFGWSRQALSLSATARMREMDGAHKVSAMLRGSWDAPRLALSGTAERRNEVDFTRVEGSARFVPLSFLALSVAASRTFHDDTTITGRPLAYRAEAALRYKRLWLGGGTLYRDPARLVAPILFDTGFRGLADPSATGVITTIRGKFYKDVGLDVVALKWDAERGFKPTYQTRSQLYVDTSWPSRFPSGNLNILAAITHEYRTPVAFPADSSAVLLSSQYRTLGFLLEIRLLQATLSYQFRNILNAEYSQVPGFLLPRPVQFYGVRWNFFN